MTVLHCLTMHEVSLRASTREERDYLAGWVEPGCLLSLLFHKNPNDPFVRLVNADIAAGETELLTFTAIRCANGGGYIFILDGGDGWFLLLESQPVSDAECVGAEPPADAAPDEVFPARVEVVRAPRSGLVHSMRLHTDVLCPVDRQVPLARVGLESLLIRSSWDRLEQDVERAVAARPFR